MSNNNNQATAVNAKRTLPGRKVAKTEYIVIDRLLDAAIVNSKLKASWLIQRS